jgi:hypothetical protein
MKAIAIAIAAALTAAGFAALWAAQRHEVAELRARVDEAERRPCPTAKTVSTGPGRGAPLDGVLRGLASSLGRARPHREERDRDGERGGVGEAPRPGEPLSALDDDGDRAEHERRERDELDGRRAAARTALVEQAGADAEQMARVDEAVARMNGELAGIAEEFLARTGGREPTRRESMALASDALAVLLDAEEAIRTALGDETANAAPDGSLDPQSYLDPELHGAMREMDDYQESPEGDGEQGEHGPDQHP